VPPGLSAAEQYLVEASVTLTDHPMNTAEIRLDLFERRFARYGTHAIQLTVHLILSDPVSLRARVTFEQGTLGRFTRIAASRARARANGDNPDTRPKVPFHSVALMFRLEAGGWDFQQDTFKHTLPVTLSATVSTSF
jgi:hypothetical protein